MIKNNLSRSLLIASSLVSATLTNTTTASASEVNVYSARKEALIKPLLDKFTTETGIKVNLVTGKADALLTRLKSEGSATPADVFVTTDAGRLYRAKSAGVLQAITSEELEKNIPANLRDKDNFWFGLTQRARPIFYAKDRVKPSELASYEALTNEKWKGRICIRSSSNIYNQSLVASMLDSRGEEKTLAWIEKFVTNFARKPVGGDTDQLKAVAAGQCDIAIANTYYFGRLANSDDDAKKAVANKLAIFWPNQDDRGTHVNVSGAGVIKSAKNKENAVKLIEYMAALSSQNWYAATNNEYPVVAGAKTSPTLASWGEFKQDTINLTILGEKNGAAVRLMDRAGWK